MAERLPIVTPVGSPAGHVSPRMTRMIRPPVDIRVPRGEDFSVSEWKSIRVGDVSLQTEVWGEGEPVVLIQTALSADELRPVGEQVVRSGDYQVIHYYRRGYSGSGPLLRPGSVTADAADCLALLKALDVGPAHVVGVSYSAAVALTLASRTPDAVRTLTVMEPPPLEVPSAPEFIATNIRLSETFIVRGAAVALDEFLTMLAGPDWRRQSERDLPGSVAAMERDAQTFFESDLPALLSWEFGSEDAARVTCPVLYVGGSHSGPWFAEVRTRILHLLPQAENCTVQGAGHLLALTHPLETAQLIVDFLRRYPRSGIA